MFGGLRMGEILIILLVVVVFFGKDRLPNLGGSLGQAIRNFKKGFGGEEEDKSASSATPSLSTGAPTSATPQPEPSKVGGKQ